ncbi:NAD(P)-dependent oxidoreductase [Gillisia sp. Hel_I_29]|uniref:NAD(P)-dependent oxidoreductase n=1 Tax=Gillisia sp. Hel_I_29 TaxID=1249975 RepID=UPI000555B274|nr:NAD(P)-dependent oxidoreductase [Gillisia sp. Hel_I_29]
MRKFNKIVAVDNTKLQENAIDELKKYSEGEVQIYNDYPLTNAEIIKRIGDAEAMLVSWHTQISEEVIAACPNLKYIGMCSTLFNEESANVAVNFARQNGIEVTGINDYGDPGVAEYIISTLIHLLHGFGEKQWREMPVELTNRKIGIIGLGVTGKLLAKCLLPFGADLYYFSKSRKKDWEEKGVKYLSLEELLKTSEIISIHLPKNVQLLNEREFEVLGSGKILVNTSLGLPFNEEALKNWIKDSSNYAIFDGDAKNALDGRILKNKNIIFSEKSAGWSAETEIRLSKKVVQNVKNYLK